ncbi:phage holin family protein [Cryobacterium sp. CG_9.6]|uniref:phage holin family protein n=1 Tax=Cryobacterium sp. CG_9.6 TaxID=2760710 RepID=UPI002475FABB|nr:phage holin family protein [Cryobacterium sp. CG_9.6]MDH6235528.1 putative membrane protein [Cryobacterium sp. CG_9.6]
MTTSGFNPKSKRSLITLLAELPGQISDLVKAELDAFKAEFASKAKNFGVGAVLFIVAAAIGFFALGVLIALLIIVFDLFLPLWLATLIVFALLLAMAAVLVLVGINRVKAATAPDPAGVHASLRNDVDALKGVGRYEN